MSLNKKYLWRMIYSCVVWLIITICILAIGMSMVSANGNSDGKVVFKGWSKEQTISDNGGTAGFNSLNDLFNGSDYQSLLNKGLFIISILAFLFSLAYFIYSLVIYIISFKRDDFINNKIQLILDIVFTLFIALFAVLTLGGMASIVSDFNKAYSKNGEPIFKLGTNFIVSTILIVFALVGHVVCASLVNTKYK